MKMIRLLVLAGLKLPGHLLALLFVIAVFSSFEAAALDCEALNKEPGPKKLFFIPSKESGRTTIGKGRIAFFSAPDRRCVEKGVFVLPGERLNAYLEYGEFTSVMYMNLKTGAEADGWVLSSRVQENGFGIGPN